MVLCSLFGVWQIDNLWFVSFNVSVTLFLLHCEKSVISNVFLKIEMHTIYVLRQHFQVFSFVCLFLSHRKFIMFCISYIPWSRGIYLFPLLKIVENLGQKYKETGELWKGKKIWMMESKKKLVVFGKVGRSPILDKNLGCLLLELCVESFLNENCS